MRLFQSLISLKKSTADYALSFTRHFVVNDNALVVFEDWEMGILVNYPSAIVIPAFV